MLHSNTVKKCRTWQVLKIETWGRNYTYVSMNMIVLYVWICACLQNLIIFIAGVVSWKKTPWPWYSFSFAQHLWVNMVVFRCTNWCWTLVDMNIYFIYMLFLVWTLNKCLTCQLLMIEMTYKLYLESFILWNFGQFLWWDK